MQSAMGNVCLGLQNEILKYTEVCVCSHLQANGCITYQNYVVNFPKMVITVYCEETYM